MWVKMIRISTLFIAIYLMLVTSFAQAGPRFSSDYPCSDAGKYCISSGTRTVQGFEVHRDCWEWAYNKTCNYPSKNDCAKHVNCYSLGQVDCILRDRMGNCVNIKKEFSCKRYEPTYIESETVRYGSEDREGEEALVCEGIACIDGNCIDKSYEMDTDMVSSISQLSAMSQGKNSDAGFKIFEGQGRNCGKKAAGYCSCCNIYPKGWGKKIGAKCSKEEVLLSELRSKNLCVYVGKEKKRKLKVVYMTKHHFCCFSNILEKTIQVQARKQLGMNFGSGGSPNCRGLTLEELSRVDFSKMDFSEVAAELMQKMAMPDIADINDRIRSAKDHPKEFNRSTPAHPDNKSVGVNPNFKEEQ